MQIVNPDLPNEKFLNTPENILLNSIKGSCFKISFAVLFPEITIIKQPPF